jgi:hypothetical protein
MPPLLSSIAAATARAYGFAAASFPTETTVEYLVIAGGGGGGREAGGGGGGGGYRTNYTSSAPTPSPKASGGGGFCRSLPLLQHLERLIQSRLVLAVRGKPLIVRTQVPMVLILYLAQLHLLVAAAAVVYLQMHKPAALAVVEQEISHLIPLALVPPIRGLQEEMVIWGQGQDLLVVAVVLVVLV